MKPKDYDRNVFINCAFEPAFIAMFRAIVYTVHDCGFIARCALEAGNKDGVRIDRIIKIIEQCKYGIHDLSCIELTDESPLPRFNMPYELGIFIGGKHFGDTYQKKKEFLVLDAVPHRYKQLISDLAGFDFPHHNNDINTVIGNVRDWFSQTVSKQLPGAVYYQERYGRFLKDYPIMCKSSHYDPITLNFKDFYALVTIWIQAENAKLLNED